MSTSAVMDPARAAERRATLPRLLAGLQPERAVSLAEHVSRYGALPQLSEARLVEIVEASGLRGRGGSGFPTAAKLRAVRASRRRPVVVVNATEGEPLSGKDKVLLRHLPHLVLDGAVAAASALGARDAYVAVSEDARPEYATLVDELAVRQRRSNDGRVRLRLCTIPAGFVAGEETALVNALNGNPARPTFKPPLPFERGVRGAPTLVQNAETLAHLALIVRFGPNWFRELGTADEPGSVLVTLSGAIRRPGVYEIAAGTPLTELLTRAGGTTEPPQAFLVGGYFGTWIRADGEPVHLSNAQLRERNASLGAGAIFVLPGRACGVTETARVARYLSDQSAGQCGPCVHGLAATAHALERIAACDRSDERRRIVARLDQIQGRGACRHPDGASHFVRSALTVFGDEVQNHLDHRRCRHVSKPLLPVPAGSTR